MLYTMYRRKNTDKYENIVALNSATVETIWRKPQLVLVMRKDVVAVNPESGALLWHHRFDPTALGNIATPLFNGDDLVFFSAAFASGSRAIKLTDNNGTTIPTEQWFSRKLRVHHGNVIRVGNHVYGSSGDSGVTLFVGMDIRTGKRAWSDRNLGKSNCVYGDGKLFALDENGLLSLATVSPDGLTVHSKCQITERASWTVPTLAGRTLYVRDRKETMALDVG